MSDMSVAEPRYCARGKRCKWYDPKTDKAQQLDGSNPDDVCRRCKKAEQDADFLASQEPTTAKSSPRKIKEKTREERLELLKLELVTQMLGKPGDFREAVKKVRSYWRIDDPPVERLPELEEENLVPPILKAPGDLSELRAAWSHHPDLPAGPPEDVHSVVRNLERQWQLDLSNALLLGGVPGRYLEKPSPHVGHPPTSTRMLPWLRFAAACVLCDVPPEQAEAFAEVGGVPSLSGDVEGESILGVIGPREQREHDIAAAVREAYDAKFIEKLWTLRSEVGDDLGNAMRKVPQRYGEELQKECEQAREHEEEWLEVNPPRKYLIEYDPKKDTEKDIKRITDAIDAELGLSPEGKKGRQAKGIFRRVQFARLLKRGWTVARVAREYGFKASTVEKYAGEGKKHINSTKDNL
jgi:hypothetical protein